MILSEGIDSIQKSSSAPIVITYENTSDAEQKAYIFETFNKNASEIKIYVDGWDSNDGALDFFKRYYYDSPREIKLIRIQTNTEFKDSQQKHFCKFSMSPSGQSITIPFINWIEVFDTCQFQEKIIDVEKPFLIDGLSQDILFRLAPKEKMTFIYWTEKVHENGRNNFKERFEAECTKNISLRVNTKTICFDNNSDYEIAQPLCESGIMSMAKIDGRFAIGKSEIDQIDYMNNLLKIKEFNNIRVVVLDSAHGTDQLFSPIKIKNIDYYPLQSFGNQFSNKVIDIPLGKTESIERALDITLKLYPHTNVVYLLQNKKDLPEFESNVIQYNVTANAKLSCLIPKSEIIKIRFNSLQDMENPIVINDGAMVIHPLAFSDETKCNIQVLVFDGKDIPEITSIKCASSFEIIAGNDVFGEVEKLDYSKEAFKWTAIEFYPTTLEPEISEILFQFNAAEDNIFDWHHSIKINGHVSTIRRDNLNEKRLLAEKLYSRSAINSISQTLFTKDGTIFIGDMANELSFYNNIQALKKDNSRPYSQEKLITNMETTKKIILFISFN